ncbi:LysM peptidoglycan-binding domain-containing protein [Bacillus marinisedimentorum]|uniref:LysM peptidoglycan-binding domain-containing protein n=1 Tax=Bacillus marinisedimentorum TaxID=1821260 RepID=UPI000871BD21|nr:LysM domain-containing protein [Bacillus marinisedimentorum]
MGKKYVIHSLLLALFLIMPVVTAYGEEGQNLPIPDDSAGGGQLNIFDSENPQTDVPRFDQFIYMVRADDTVYTISEKFGFDLEKLVELNDLVPPYELTEGQLLEIPINDITDLQQTESHEYTVKKGDTLSEIAEKYGLDWHDLAIWNKLENPHLILIGQKILFPATEKQEQEKNVIIFYRAEN